MSYETILLEIKDRVGLITLNRPQALNALNAQIVSELNQALDSLEADPKIGCIVLTGSKKAFAAGADIKEMAELTYPQIYLDDLFSDSDRVANRRKPIIAAVNGFALGGGCELALMCDFILAGDNAKFGQPEINLGVLPGMGGMKELAGQKPDEKQLGRIEAIINSMTPEERLKLEQVLHAPKPLWSPDPKNAPQTMAFHSMADVIGFGGAAGQGGGTCLKSCGRSSRSSSRSVTGT